MNKVPNIKVKKIMIALLLVSATHLALGSFTGTSEEKSKNKYSLKDFNKHFYKNASPYSLRAGYQFKGSQIVSLNRDENSVQVNSMMRFEKGNTTYIYPYKHKVVVPKFKTPAPPVH